MSRHPFLPVQLVSGAGTSQLQLDPSQQQPLFFIVPRQSDGTTQVHEVLNVAVSDQNSPFRRDSGFNTISFASGDGAGGVCSFSPFVSFGSPQPVHSFQGAGYAPPQASIGQPANHSRTISYLPPGAVEPPGQPRVTYMLMGPNVVTQDASGFLHYTTPAQPSLALQPGPSASPHATHPGMLIQGPSQTNYAPRKGNTETAQHRDSAIGIPIVTRASLSAVNVVAPALGDTIAVASLPPPYKPTTSSLGGGSPVTHEVGGRHGSNNPRPKGSQRARLGPPASLATTCGVRSFVAPPPVGARFVPNAPLIMTVPPLARRIPDWGVLPPRAHEVATVP